MCLITRESCDAQQTGSYDVDDAKHPDHNRDTIGYVSTTVGSLFSRSGKPIEAR